MKKKMKNIGVAALLVLATVLTTQTIRAGFGGYSPIAITNATVTAPGFVTNMVYVSLPSIAFTATATNGVKTTNSIIQGFPGTTFTNMITFVYDSSIYGTNFSTNFPPVSFTVPSITGFQCVPASTNSGTVLETFN